MSKVRVARKLAGGVILLCLLGAAFAAGYLFDNNHLIPPRFRSFIWDTAPAPDGRWKTVRTVEIGVMPEAEALKALESIGYLGAVEPDRIHERGVLHHDAAATQPGVNFYLSGHAPEAYLTNLQGEVLHTWQHRLPLNWRAEDDPAEGIDARDFWRRAAVLPDGDLVAIFEGIGLIRLNKDSELLWGSTCNAHHDLWVHEDGRISVLTRRASMIDRLNPEAPILEDFIATLTPDGEVIEEVSLLECLERSAYAPLLRYVERSGDLLHTNTLELLDGRHAGRHPAFAAGNWLVSCRNLNLIGVVDPRERRFVWALTGLWSMQHEPTLTNDGNVLLFDNQGLQGFSRVMEIDPLTHELVWEFSENLFSEALGAAYRLENGNTLIVESNAGRVLEVAPDHSVVWEFVNPQQYAPSPELLPIIPDCVRLPSEFVQDWVVTPEGSS